MNRRDFIKECGWAGATTAALAAGLSSLNRESHADETTASTAPAAPASDARPPVPPADTPPLAAWVQTSLTRIYPKTPPPASAAPLRLPAARNDRVSFQVGVRNNRGDAPVTVSIELEAPKGVQAVVRRIGYVPIAHLNTGTSPEELEGRDQVPGYVPDPLFPEQKVTLGPEETHAFYVSVAVAADTAPGEHKLQLRILQDKTPPLLLEATLDVHPLVVNARRDFPVTQWWFFQCIADYYKLAPYEEAMWPLMETYIRNAVEHGINMQLVPLLHFGGPQKPRQPTQLLKIESAGPGQYTFDFAQVKRFVDMAKRCGIEHFEWPHLFSSWGAKFLTPLFHTVGGKPDFLLDAETPALAPPSRTFLAQLFPAFHRFLQQEGILENSYFHISDEPGGDEHFKHYGEVRVMLKELAPWMKTFDALSEVRYAKENVCDIPVPQIDHIPAFQKAGYRTWTYFCTQPRGPYLNRLMDTPLAKIRMSGWLFYKTQVKGFLHWGHNYWYKFLTETMIDPFTESAGMDWPGIPYGDCFVVYPGPKGPLDSLRYEAFAESLYDYALLQSAALRPDDPLLAPLKDYADFPKTEEWLLNARSHVLKQTAG